MLCIKIQNVIYKNPIFAPPARPKPPMLYMVRRIYSRLLKYWIWHKCNKTGILLVGPGILRYSALEYSGDARGTSWNAEETEYRPQSPSGALCRPALDEGGQLGPPGHQGGRRGGLSVLVTKSCYGEFLVTFFGFRKILSDFFSTIPGDSWTTTTIPGDSWTPRPRNHQKRRANIVVVSRVGRNRREKNRTKFF